MPPRQRLAPWPAGMAERTQRTCTQQGLPRVRRTPALALCTRPPQPAGGSATPAGRPRAGATGPTAANRGGSGSHPAPPASATIAAASMAVALTAPRPSPAPGSSPAPGAIRGGDGALPSAPVVHPPTDAATLLGELVVDPVPHLGEEGAWDHKVRVENLRRLPPSAAHDDATVAEVVVPASATRGRPCRASVDTRGLRLLAQGGWLDSIVMEAGLRAIEAYHPGTAEKALLHTAGFDAGLRGNQVSDGPANTYNFKASLTNLGRQFTPEQFCALDVVVTVVNHGNAHWAVCAAWPATRRCGYYDSLRYTDSAVRDSYAAHACNRLTRWVDDYEKEVGVTAVRPPSWTRVGSSDYVPKQNNGNDCGVFSLYFAELIALGRVSTLEEASPGPSFVEDHSTHLRDSLTHHLLQFPPQAPAPGSTSGASDADDDEVQFVGDEADVLDSTDDDAAPGAPPASSSPAKVTNGGSTSNGGAADAATDVTGMGTVDTSGKPLSASGPAPGASGQGGSSASSTATTADEGSTAGSASGGTGSAAALTTSDEVIGAAGATGTDTSSSPKSHTTAGSYASVAAPDAPSSGGATRGGTPIIAPSPPRNGHSVAGLRGAASSPAGEPRTAAPAPPSPAPMTIAVCVAPARTGSGSPTAVTSILQRPGSAPASAAPHKPADRGAGAGAGSSAAASAAATAAAAAATPSAAAAAARGSGWTTVGPDGKATQTRPPASKGRTPARTKSNRT